MPPKIENPVNNPNVPPIPDNMVANFAALSLVILSNVGVSKKIFTNLILLFHSKSRIDNFMENIYRTDATDKTNLSILVM